MRVCRGFAEANTCLLAKSEVLSTSLSWNMTSDTTIPPHISMPHQGLRNS